jgi:uncharacterized protein (UPF0261 family)
MDHVHDHANAALVQGGDELVQLADAALVVEVLDRKQLHVCDARFGEAVDAGLDRP